MTREHVTVALNGDGGDENFAGLNHLSASRSRMTASFRSESESNFCSVYRHR